MSATSINWDETAPADSRNAGLGASDIRSILSNIRGGLGAEHIWPTSAGNAGVHKPGSAVAFYGTASQVSSSDTEGRLMVTSDSTNLYGVHSAITVLYGSRFVVLGPAAYTGLAGSVVTSKVTQHWTMEVGTSQITARLNTLTFRNSYVSPPTVLVTPTPFASATFVYNVVPDTNYSSGAMTLVNYNTTSGASEAPASSYTASYIAAGFVANG